jgi:transposase
MARKPYPSDVTDSEWDFVVPYLTLMNEDAPQREHDLREVFNGMRYVVRAGEAWRMMPNDLPPWAVVYQQAQRWIAAGVFEAMTQDLRRILRALEGRAEEPSAAIFDSRTLQSTPESGHRGGYDGAKRKKGSKVHMAVDTLGYLLSLHVTPADQQDREQVGKLAKDVQKQTGKSVELAYVDQGHRRPRGGGGEEAQDRVVGGEAARGQARVRAAATALGGRAELRVVDAFPPAGQGLRAACVNAQGHALGRVRDPHAGSTGKLERKCITRSKWICLVTMM